MNHKKIKVVLIGMLVVIVAISGIAIVEQGSPSLSWMVAICASWGIAIYLVPDERIRIPRITLKRLNYCLFLLASLSGLFIVALFAFHEFQKRELDKSLLLNAKTLNHLNAEVDTRLRRALVDDEMPEVGEIADNPLFSAIPDKKAFVRNAAVASWMERQSGKRIVPGSAGWQPAKDALARSYFKHVVSHQISDREIHMLIRVHILTMDKITLISRNAVVKELPLLELLNDFEKLHDQLYIKGLYAEYRMQLFQQYIEFKEVHDSNGNAGSANFSSPSGASLGLPDDMGAFRRRFSLYKAKWEAEWGGNSLDDDAFITRMAKELSAKIQAP